MNNNDIMRRIRFTFDFSDSEMIKLFALADFEVSRADVSDWLKRDDDPEFRELQDIQLAVFLNGLIVLNRGRKEGPQPEPERRLNNNIIFRKLKIALNLKDEDILDILALAGMNISKHELSAFFRNPKQIQYRPCNDQMLRKFLIGMQKKYKGSHCHPKVFKNHFFKNRISPIINRIHQINLSERVNYLHRITFFQVAFPLF